MTRRSQELAGPVQADVQQADGLLWRVRLRGDRVDLFAPQRALRDLDVEVGSRLLVDSDYTTCAADVISIDPAGELELQLLADLPAETWAVTLRHSLRTRKGLR